MQKQKPSAHSLATQSVQPSLEMNHLAHTTHNRHMSYIHTSHANIVYRKQLPPQRTVSTIGSKWHENNPLKETMRPAQTSPQSTKNQPIT